MNNYKNSLLLVISLILLATNSAFAVEAEEISYYESTLESYEQALDYEINTRGGADFKRIDYIKTVIINLKALVDQQTKFNEAVSRIDQAKHQADIDSILGTLKKLKVPLYNPEGKNRIPNAKKINIQFEKWVIKTTWLVWKPQMGLDVSGLAQDSCGLALGTVFATTGVLVNLVGGDGDSYYQTARDMVNIPAPNGTCRSQADWLQEQFVKSAAFQVYRFGTVTVKDTGLSRAFSSHAATLIFDQSGPVWVADGYFGKYMSYEKWQEFVRSKGYDGEFIVNEPSDENQ